MLCVSAHAASDYESRDRIKSLYGESDAYEHFFYELKNALLAKDIKKVAQLNEYPIRVNFEKGTKYFNDQSEFMADYNKIITNEMLARVKKQTFAELFANSYGMHIGNGDIWFTGICIGTNLTEPCEKISVKVTSYNVNHTKE